MNCASKLSDNDMYTHILNIDEMDKVERNVLLMGALGECDRQTKHGKKQVRSRRQFNFQACL